MDVIALLLTLSYRDLSSIRWNNFDLYHWIYMSIKMLINHGKPKSF